MGSQTTSLYMYGLIKYCKNSGGSTLLENQPTLFSPTQSGYDFNRKNLIEVLTPLRNISISIISVRCRLDLFALDIDLEVQDGGHRSVFLLKNYF